MNARLIRTLALALVVFVFCPLWVAQAAKAKSKSKTKESVSPPVAAVTTESDTLPPAELTVGFQSRDSETEGIGDLLVPLWNPGGTGLLFINPRSALTDHDGEEANLGVGYRQLLPKQKVIVGANAYYDYRDTGDNNYDQWGVGFEILSSWIDARANYYEPDDKTHVVGSQTETETSQSSKTTSGWTDPYAVDHYIVQDYTITRTLTTHTTTKTFEQYEQALGGYDWEIGLRLPLPVKQETLEARVFGGAYDFDRDFGADAQGWKARAELRLLSSLFLDGGIYENADLTGSDWFAGARLSVPLDLAKIAQGRNPFATAKSRINSEPRDFGARLTEMVMRDPQIRLETSKFLENKSLETTDTTQTRNKTSQHFPLMGNLNFVDGDSHSMGDGSAAHPFPTIQLGVNAALESQNVYVFNASHAYEENVVLKEGITLLGSGSLIQGYNGQFFGSGIPPIVDGMSMGPSITMADNTTVRGFFIRNTDMGGPAQFLRFPYHPAMEERSSIPGLDISRVGIFGNGATDLTITENIIAGNSTGVLLVSQDDFDDFNLSFTHNLVMNNSESGLQVDARGTDNNFNVLVQDSRFTGNGESGMVLEAQDYNFALARILDSEFIGNHHDGAAVDLSRSRVTMALVSGVLANENTGTGLLVDQIENDVSLANLSDITANENMRDGVELTQFSHFASIGVIGMPTGVGSTVNEAHTLFDFTLPDELAMFLEPEGPVQANHNGQSGVDTHIIAEDGIAFGALFDISANYNEFYGVSAMIDSPSGVAIGLAGSSENWADILNLGSQIGGLFGIDIPVSLAGNGHLEANNNGGIGFLMQTMGSNAAISAVVGLDTRDNAGPGTYLGTYSDNLAISALARVNAFHNGGGGLYFDVVGVDDAAIGILADVNASNNGNNGISADVMSENGSAVLLTLSTDLFRPIASVLGDTLLGAPFELPGDSFGPVIASGNDGDGISAHVGADGIAAAVFLDTQADGNHHNGFDLRVISTNGTAISAIIASDLVFELLAEVLPIDPLDFEPLGRISASDNGDNGILIHQMGYDGAYSLLAGIDADDNHDDGVNVSLFSPTGNVAAILVDVDADSNGDTGTRLDLLAYESAISALLYTDADDNGDQGFKITQNSLHSDSWALLGGVDAWFNEGKGIVYSLTAADDASVYITDAQSEYNGGKGADFTLNAGDNASFILGADFVGNFGSVLMELVPRGTSEFNFNDGAGLQVELNSTDGDALMYIENADAYGNTNKGFNISMNATNGNVRAYFDGLNGSANGDDGLNLNILGGAGSTNNLGLFLSDTLTANNGGNGIKIDAIFNGNTEIGAERIVSINNDANGVRVDATSTGSLALDFGGGTLGSMGQSSIYGNGNRDFRESGPVGTAMAQSNWWGTASPVSGQFAGTVDYSSWLLTDPNP